MIDFSSTILIATSKLDVVIVIDKLTQPEVASKTDMAMRESTIQVLKKHFRPVFPDRIDKLIVFKAFSKENIHLIVQIRSNRIARTAATQDLTLQICDSLFEPLVEVGY